MPVAEAPDDLVVHELVHVWQDQHRRWRMWLSYLGGYKNNRQEVEARRAVAITRSK
jgi:predicted metal-dependent hydrolase